jgi:cytidylate kinase
MEIGVDALSEKKGLMSSKQKDLEAPTIVAVDGPAGSGKSSICAQVAEQIGWTYLNTGALYRGVGVIALEQGINLDDEAAVAGMLDEVAPDLRWDSTTKSLLYKDENLSSKLLTREAGIAASKVAKQSLVRERLLPVQRDLILASPHGALVDGRDIGTVVFPNAELKIFLTASLDERAKRRLKQLQGTDKNRNDAETLNRIREEISSRDSQDERRGEAPLRKADDAIEVDTSSMTIVEVIEHIVLMIKERGFAK